jgi:hypothetical protein
LTQLSERLFERWRSPRQSECEAFVLEIWFHLSQDLKVSMNACDTLLIHSSSSQPLMVPPLSFLPHSKTRTHLIPTKENFSRHISSLHSLSIGIMSGTSKYAQIPILHRSRLESGPPITTNPTQPETRPASSRTNRRVNEHAKYQITRGESSASCPST